jgi:hypothetical protein
MLVLLVGGLFAAVRMTQEVFPEFDLDLVTVSVPYPGASPEEVEEGIVLVVEEAVRALEGVKEVTATAAEGVGSVVIELEENADAQKALLDVQEAVARVRTFPVDAEEPNISLLLHRHDVMSLQIYGATGRASSPRSPSSPPPPAPCCGWATSRGCRRASRTRSAPPATTGSAPSASPCIAWATRRPRAWRRPRGTPSPRSKATSRPASTTPSTTMTPRSTPSDVTC